MKKFNAIHILEAEQKQNDLIHRNLGKEHHQKQLTRFVSKYILPQFVKLNNEGKITYNLNTDDRDIFFKSKQLEMYLYNIVDEIVLQNDDLDILNTDDKELINAVVKDVTDFVLNTYEQYIVDYDNNNRPF